MVSRHQAIRTCVGCGSQKPKPQLRRIVRTKLGEVLPDLTGKAQGRGVYLCPEACCLERAMNRKSLERSLKVNLTQEDRQELARRLLQQMA